VVFFWKILLKKKYIFVKTQDYFKIVKISAFDTMNLIFYFFSLILKNFKNINLHKLIVIKMGNHWTWLMNKCI